MGKWEAAHFLSECFAHGCQHVLDNIPVDRTRIGRSQSQNSMRSKRSGLVWVKQWTSLSRGRGKVMEGKHICGSHLPVRRSGWLVRMNKRIAFAMTIWECKPWSWQIFSKQFRVATKIFDQQNSWTAATSTWTPTNEWQQHFSTEPKRRQGRPSKRRDDNVEKYAMNYFRMSWATAARIRPEWQFFDQVYLQFCM